MGVRVVFLDLKVVDYVFKGGGSDRGGGGILGVSYFDSLLFC